LALFALPIIFKLVAAAVINDAGYETTVKVLKKIEPKDFTGVSSKFLQFLASDQDIPQGITLKDSTQRNEIVETITQSDFNVKILDAAQVKSQLPEVDPTQYDLVVSGKPRDIIEVNNLIINDIESIAPLSKDEPMNTVFGRLYDLIRKKLPTPKP
jgi:hypothetical protein